MNKLFVLISLSIFFGLTTTSQTFSEGSCEYGSDIESCYAENESGGDPRVIEDFVCLQSQNKEWIAYQVVLDRKFSEVDEVIIEYLELLQEDKTKYFGSEREEVFYEGVKDVFDMFKVYGKVWDTYYNLCSTGKDSILSTTMTCMGGKTNVNMVDRFFRDTDCTGMATLKTVIYEQVAMDILKLNKNQVRRDAKKKYVQEQREKTNALIELIHVSLGYVERIWKKWPSKTDAPY